MKILNLPWRVAPLEGKYYGTGILDACGAEVLNVWDHSDGSGPSSREKAEFQSGRKWDQAAWDEYACDGHWECERDYEVAQLIVYAVNGTYGKDGA